MTVRIITDSTASLSKDVIARYNLRVLTLYVVSNNVAEPEVDMDVAAYYERLKDLDALPTSSQPTPQQFRDAFTEVLDAGDEALGIFTAGGLSGTVEGARMVAQQLIEERPDCALRIAIVDSKSNCMAQTYPVLAAARAAEAGKDLTECADIAEYVAACTRFIFVPASLEYLRRGGRIGRASAMLGSMLKLTPVLGPDNVTGMVHTYAKVRTVPRALNAVKEKWQKDIADAGGLKAVCVHYIVDRAPADAFREKVIVPLTRLVVPTPIAVGPVIGTHVGPAVGLAYVCNHPLEPGNSDGWSSLTSGVRTRFSDLKQRFADRVDNYIHPKEMN